ncbi:MAG: WhiB family transcriptional regulator [Frankia sp.]|nr:WhiB family transcriptional regulator [Frankia sp.]
MWFPEGAPAAEVVRVCAGCPVRRGCVADDLALRYPAGVRAGLDEDAREPLHAAYAEYRDAIAVRYRVLRRLADRAAGPSRSWVLRELAESLAAEADALTGYALALALAVPAAEWVAARDAYMGAVAVRRAAEQAAGLEAATVGVRAAWTRLLAAAHRVALAAAAPAVSASSVPSALVGLVGAV